MPYAVVQSGISVTGGGGTSTRTFTPTSGLTAGNNLTAELMYFQNSGDAARTIVGITDQSLNALSYLEPPSQIYITDTGTLAFAIPNLPSGVTSITVTMSGAPAFGSSAIWAEVSGLVTSLTNDGTNSLGASVGTGTDAVVSGSASNSAQPAVCIGLCSETAFTSVPAVGTGFTDIVGSNGMRMEIKRLTSTGSQQATFTNTHGGSAPHATSMFIFDELGGGSPIIIAPYPWSRPVPMEI